MVAPVDECAAGQTEAVQRHAAIPVASAVVATLEVAIPDNASQAADVGSFYVAEGVKRLAGARASKEQDLEAVTKTMVAPADEFTTGQAEVVRDGREDGGGYRGKNNREAAVATPVTSASPAIIATPKVAVPADVGHAVRWTRPERLLCWLTLAMHVRRLAPSDAHAVSTMAAWPT